MRKVDNFVLHCTATSQKTSIASIQHFWRSVLKWINPGYHYIILPDGSVVQLQPVEKIANGVAGNNHNSIHICYIGGVDEKGRAVDNRTKAQKLAQIDLLRELRKDYPNARILGHRDFPGVTKECPSFDVAAWLECVGL